MQTGHPDEWEFTPFSHKPDTGLIIDEPDEDSAVTEDFIRHVRFWMVTLVEPYINDNGIFVPEDENAGDCYSG